MSLLVFSSSSRISQGLIRQFYKSGQFERIVAADLYPNYWGLQRFLNFRHSLGTEGKTRLTDVKITNASDLHEAVRGSSHVVYVTHDYYSNVPSKLNLLGQTARLAKKYGVQRFVSVTPAELDHYGESDPIFAANNSENDARAANPDVIQVKSDLTFGADADVLTRLQGRIVNGQSIAFKPVGQSPAPIFVGDLAAIVEKVLASGDKGARFFAQGPQKIDWFNIITVLEKSLGAHYVAQLNKSSIESVLSPTSTNILTESIYCDSYLNLAQFIARYHLNVGKDFRDISELGVKLTEFAEHYKTQPVKAEDLKCKSGDGVACLLY